VVPQSLPPTPVTADPGPALSSYDMNAAFMPFQRHERGIHALWSGDGPVSPVTEVCWEHRNEAPMPEEPGP
jgi:hypothetical protein